MGKENGHYEKIVSVQPNSSDWIKVDSGLDAIEKLAKVRQMSIRQHFSKVEMLTPVDRRNFYKLWNGETGEMVFQAQEGDIGCCLRTCCQGQREFDMPFVDENEKTIFSLHKSRSAPVYGCCACYINCCWHLCNKCKCCGFSDDYSNLTVAVGQHSFYIKLVYNGCSGHPLFEIRDLKNGSKLVFTITLNSCCPSGYNCTDVVYDVNDADGNVVATISKFWGGGLPGCKGCCKECYNANSFVIDYGEDQTPTEKVALIGATILIDFAFYQAKDNNQ